MIGLMKESVLYKGYNMFVENTLKLDNYQLRVTESINSHGNWQLRQSHQKYGLQYIPMQNTRISYKYRGIVIELL